MDGKEERKECKKKEIFLDTSIFPKWFLLSICKSLQKEL